MSSEIQENPTNNQRQPPPNVTLMGQTYPRDPTYYFEDANTVFLVGGVLFKIQLSLLTPDSKTENPDFDSCIKHLLGDSNTPIARRGTSDSDALPISDVSSGQFRHLLLALLGRPGDPEYAALFTDAQSQGCHTQDAFVRYLDIGTLARRFGMNKLGSWAQSQLRLLFKSARALSSSIWDKDILLQTLIFGRLWDQPFASETQVFVRFMLTPSISIHMQSPTTANINLNTCVSLYKDPKVSKDNHAFLGWIIAVLLSRGHLSDTWLDELSRDDRLILHATQAELSAARDTLDLRFLPLRDAFGVTVCSACSPHADAAQKSSFDLLGDLKSKPFLDYIRGLIELPYYHQVFADALGSPTWVCDSGCCKKLLVQVDKKVEWVLSFLSWVREDFTDRAVYPKFLGRSAAGRD